MADFSKGNDMNNKVTHLSELWMTDGNVDDSSVYLEPILNRVQTHHLRLSCGGATANALREALSDEIFARRWPHVDARRCRTGGQICGDTLG